MITLVPVSVVLASERGAAPPQTIDTSSSEQRHFWAFRLSVSSDDLAAAIDAVGPSVAAIRRHLGK